LPTLRNETLVLPRSITSSQHRGSSTKQRHFSARKIYSTSEDCKLIA
ncbi:hypothetical protein CCACVL1_18177, partial [Corchorus capsularis]